ncbi:response regulator transcription factor [Kiloniella sp. b19]|uniref:response regulator transcription factor n=1 Tax=Kiloniella sp. GXU_MW_B19 TaxID=3141326 RepID=UPI0031D56911
MLINNNKLTQAENTRETFDGKNVTPSKNFETKTPVSETILLIDDDPDFLDTLSFLLTNSGYRVRTASDGTSMYRELKRDQPNLVILDVGLGLESGFELTNRLRKESQIPIIILSAKNEEASRVIGLELGADDYINKPYSTAELLARIKSVLRRSEQNNQSSKDSAYFNGLICDCYAKELWTQESRERINLTSGEFILLEIFLNSPNQVLSRERILDLSGKENVYDRSIDVQLLRMKRKIKDKGISTDFIKPIRSIGYIFSAKIKWSKGIEIH